MGEEQFRLCEELRLQSGLLAYVALHCVEAASLMVARRSGPNNAGGVQGCLEAERYRLVPRTPTLY